MAQLPWLDDSALQAVSSWVQSDPSLERRKEYLALLQRVLRETVPEVIMDRRGRINPPLGESWEDWVRLSGELPPDFQEMPSCPIPPDPLQDLTGSRIGRIRTREQWDCQREWIKSQFHHWIIGTFPPPPENLTAKVTEVLSHGDATLHRVMLNFGPNREASLRLDIFVPQGKGPFPGFVTVHPVGETWVRVPLRRGYVVCVVKTADPWAHGADDSDPWIELFPDYDFSCMGRWAWAKMRGLDYLLTLPFIDPEQIVVGGNSRYAKAALIAAAFDERFKVCLPSRGNCGCGISWRNATGMFTNETLEEITRTLRHWFHPRLRYFTGREDKLPVDQNLLVSLVAPRGLLLSHAYTEHQGNPWAIEQTYRSARMVYEFLGAEENLGLLQRPGEHTVVVDVLEQYVDFCDGVLGRGPFETPVNFVNGYTFDMWEATQGDLPGSIPEPPVQGKDWRSDFERGMPWATVRARTRRRIQWVLGEGPSFLQRPERRSMGYSASVERERPLIYPSTLFNRPLRSEDLGVSTIGYGDNLQADIYYATRKNDPEPRWEENLAAVIWLHPYAYANGYSRYPWRAFRTLTRYGFLAIGVDLLGCGLRVEEMKEFYHRYPTHSVLGRMVLDTEALVTAIRGLPQVNSDHIYTVGSGLGAKVALFHAAMDERVRGTAAVSGFASLRDGSCGGTTEGLYHYAQLHGILPRLGQFADRPQDAPVDYDDVLSLIAPRPTFVMAPLQDRYHPVESVRGVVERARFAYQIGGDETALELETPEGFNGFEREPERAHRVIDWLRVKSRR